MWVWIVCAGIFLFLLGRSLHEGMSASSSRTSAVVSTIADGLAMVLMAVGVFGLLMALFLGVFAGGGPRLAGASLSNVTLWSAGMVGLAVAMFFLGVAARRRGAGSAPVARPARGGH